MRVREKPLACVSKAKEAGKVTDTVKGFHTHLGV